MRLALMLALVLAALAAPGRDAAVVSEAVPSFPNRMCPEEPCPWP